MPPPDSPPTKISNLNINVYAKFLIIVIVNDNEIRDTHLIAV